jgi:hypothetical protein
MAIKRNPYRTALKALWGKLNHINGILFLIVNQIERYEEQQQRLWKQKNIKFPRFAGYSLPMTDLTGPTDSGWLYHYPTGVFSVKGHEFAKMKEDVIRRISCYSVAQGYEAFETFLKDTVAGYLCVHPSKAKCRDVREFEERCGKTDRSKVTYWMELVRFAKGTYGGQDNRKLFRFLQDVVPVLKVAEKDNTRRMDLTKWYKAASVARHAITHSRLEIAEGSWNCLHKSDKTYFPCMTEGRRRFLVLKGKHAENCLRLFAEYGFLIFKCLSQSEGYEWNIVKGMAIQKGQST